MENVILMERASKDWRNSGDPETKACFEGGIRREKLPLYPGEYEIQSSEGY